MFTLLDDMPTREDPLKTAIVLLATIPAVFGLLIIAINVLTTVTIHASPTAPTRAERRQQSFIRAQKKCVDVRRPEGFVFVHGELTVGGDDVWTSAVRYRTTRPAAEIRSYFLATLEDSPKYSATDDAVRAESGAIVVNRVAESPGADEYEIRCRGEGETISFGIYDI